MSQSTPTSVNRGAANLTQVDQYLTAAKRLGIPTSATDNLAATTSPQNTAKILYNTTLNKLRVYNPVTETWRDAIEADLTDYYTKEEIDILLGGKQNTLVSGTNIKTINGETLLGSGNIDIEGALYTATNGITISGSNVISPVYGTTAGTIAQGNDSRINNGQTAYEWGDHAGLYLPVTGGTVTGVIKSPAPVADEDLANKDYVDSQSVIEALDEGSGIGYRIRGRNPDHYGNIGLEAVDLSFNSTESTTGGATGSYSSAFGVQTTASGVASSTFGASTEASGIASSAFGLMTTASGDYSLAFGTMTAATGESSAAFGGSTIASGVASSAFGSGTEASGEYSSAFGDRATASGDYSSAFGNVTTASGDYSTAFGQNTTASGSRSAAFGYETEASGDFSSAFGFRSTANEFSSLAIGQFSTEGVVETSWTVGSPIFKVGNGTSPLNRSNAYTLYNDGRSEQIKDMEVTEIGQGFVLKSPDGTRWRITVDNSGNLTTTSL